MLSQIARLGSAEKKIEALDREIQRLSDMLRGRQPRTAPEGQIRALLAVAQRKRDWYMARREYFRESAA